MLQVEQSKSERFYSREELARRWGISWKTIRRMEQDGRLPGVVYISERIARIPASVVGRCESRRGRGRRDDRAGGQAN
jgi:predicted site-specific integrase-resolvase